MIGTTRQTCVCVFCSDPERSADRKILDDRDWSEDPVLEYGTPDGKRVAVSQMLSFDDDNPNNYICC